MGDYVKVVIEVLTYDELCKARDAYEVLNELGIDTDRHQTRDYIKARIAYLERIS